MSILGSYFENIKVVQKIGSGMIKGYVGCDRMVFAISSNLFLIRINSFFNKWSLDQGQKTIIPDSEIAMVDGRFWGESFEQDRSWDDFGTTISEI